MRTTRIKDRGAFILRLPNGRKRRFKTQEAFSEACAVISHGRFIDAGQMWAAVIAMPTGY